MLPTSLITFFRNLLTHLNAYYTFFLLLGMIALSSCDPEKVPPSFGYALGGTFAIMVVGLAIATFVTSRNKKGGKDSK